MLVRTNCIKEHNVQNLRKYTRIYVYKQSLGPIKTNNHTAIQSHV